jgi:O-antigen/teichoic acid export membrane protein
VLSSRPFLRQIGTNVIAQVGGAACSFLAGLVAARWLGAEGRGALALATAVPAFLMLFLGLGTDAACVYLVGAKQMDESRIGRTASLVIIGTTVAAAVVVVVSSLCGFTRTIVPGVPTQVLCAAALGFPFLMAVALYGAVLSGKQQISRVALTALGQRAASLVLLVAVLVGTQGGIAGAALASTVAAALAAAALVVRLRAEGVAIAPAWDGECLKRLLSYGLRGYLANLLQFFNYRLDLFVINFFVGVREAGIYAVSVSLAEMLWYLPNAVGAVVFPRSARLYAHAGPNTATGESFVRRILLSTVIVCVFAAAAMVVMGRPMIRLLFSHRFDASYLPMVALLPGVVLLGATKILANDIAGRGFPEYNAIVAGFVAVITVGADLLLIPRFGALGASFASSIAYGASLAMTSGFWHRVNRVASGPSALTSAR